VRINGNLAVGRLGARSDADLAWETELLRHLDRRDLTGLAIVDRPPERRDRDQDRPLRDAT
jgi:hypothetical protein